MGRPWRGFGRGVLSPRGAAGGGLWAMAINRAFRGGRLGGGGGLSGGTPLGRRGKRKRKGGGGPRLSRPGDVGADAPAGVGVLKRPAEDLRQAEEAGDAAVVKRADEAAGGAVREAALPLDQVPLEHLPGRFARRQLRHPWVPERPTRLV